jgi:hypothetical protein
MDQDTRGGRPQTEARRSNGDGMSASRAFAGALALAAALAILLGWAL